MILKSLRDGFRAVYRRPGLALLLYGVNAVAALILVMPLYSGFSSATGITGFGTELAADFDIVLWADVMEEIGPVPRGMFAQLFWMIPVFLIWKTASAVGVINGIRDRGSRSFWTGVGRFTGKALVLALLFVVVSGVWILAVGVLVAVVGFVWEGEVAAFWLFFVTMPVLVALGLATFDLMHDYGRIKIVARGAGPFSSWLDGLRFPFRQPGSIAVYAAWLALAAAVVIFSARLTSAFGVSTLNLWSVFLLQQVVLIVRSATTVGWLGSEVSFERQVYEDQLPRLAVEPERKGDRAASHEV